MGRLRLWLRRASARRASLAVISAFVALATALVSLALAGAEIAATGAIRQTLAEASDGPPLTVRTRLADDPSAQDARMAELTESQLAPLPLTIGRHLVSEPVTIAADGESVRVELAAAPEASVLVSGAWPGDGEALVPADSALVGANTLEVDGDTLAVTGIWEPTPAPGPGSPGRAADNSGGIVLLGTEDALLALEPEPFVVWDVSPDLARVTIDELHLLSGAGERLNQELRRDDSVAVRGLTVDDQTGETATELRPRVAAARAVTVVPAGLLAALAILTLAQLAGLLARTRAAESALLGARGARRATLAAAGAGEGLLAGAIGAAAGGGIAAGILLLVPDGAAGLGVLLPAALAAAATAAAALGIAAGVASGGATTRAAQLRSGRIRRAAGFGGFVALVLATAYAGTRFAQLSGPVTGVGSEEADGDLLATLALPLTVVVIGVIALLLVGPATAVVERLASRGGGLDGALASRQVSRRLASYSVPALLLALGAAAVTTAGLFDGTALAQRETDAQLANGADVRVVLPDQNWSAAALPAAPDLSPYEFLEGVEAAALARVTEIAVGMEPASYVALPVEEISAVVADPGAAESLAEAAQSLAVEPAATLPPDADTLTIEVPIALTEVDGVPASEALEVELSAVVRVVDIHGGLSLIHAASERSILLAGGTGTVAITAELPPGAHRVPAIEFQLAVPLDGIPEFLAFPEYTEGMTDAQYEAAVEDYFEAEAAAREDGLLDSYSFIRLGLGEVTVSGGGEALATDYEIPARQADGSASWTLTPSESGDEISLFLGEMPHVGPIIFRAVSEDVPSAVPALVTEDLAEALALAPGSTLDVALDGPRLSLTVEGVVPAVPGAGGSRAVMVDLGTATAHLTGTRQSVTGPTEVWIAGGSADTVHAIAGETARVTTAELPAMDPSAAPRLTFWLAGLAGALFAAIGVAAAVVAQSRERRREVGVLSALGVPPRRVGRARALELLAVAGPALVLGVAAGAAASRWFIPELARTATVGVAPTGLASAWIPLFAALATLALGVLAVAALASARVRVQARAAGRLEEDS